MKINSYHIAHGRSTLLATWSRSCNVNLSLKTLTAWIQQKSCEISAEGQLRRCSHHVDSFFVLFFLHVSCSCHTFHVLCQADKKRAAEAAAAAASVRRLYRVREDKGVEATRTPDIVAPAADTIPAGTAFYGKAEVGVGVCGG